ncbi:alpha/beta fold hydrolase [Acidiferrimicrobium sp. IK]|uniref:alpha/beta fold hydrolase n=1 Tax=Acidiferrimicrobium sp. IK TaxID=2871700 RepID=UPI0021CB5F06|nr:alpha/beta fold hydrolase [Acidiferrimicrobium sp. IK]MCU4187008.1 alpha/beta fold hydrolase [Acidiferrimicrobium sp. IK]
MTPLAVPVAADHHLQVNGQRLHVLRLGSGASGRPKVVMIHGLVVDNLSSFYFTIANAVAVHADVYLYDLRGHGLSSIPQRSYHLGDHIADLLGLLEAWEIDEPVHLVGSSYGGLIALETARLRPELVASMLLLEAHFPVEGWATQMAGTVSLATYGLDDDSTRKWLADNGMDGTVGRKLKRMAARANLLARSTSIIEDLQAEQPFPLAALTAMSCPVTAVYGERSDIVERGHDLERLLPDARLHLVAGAEHRLLQDVPAQVRDIAVEWVTAAALGG